ncbi:hypothetical protein XA1311A_28370 [Xanthomonas arboricola]|nr:hypothetical protein XA1311A_28370 [Xanthomonas arboricola]CAE6799402.1 hypothetical protein XA1311A_28370 [Xanthomonas arboricola]
MCIARIACSARTVCTTCWIRLLGTSRWHDANPAHLIADSATDFADPVEIAAIGTGKTYPRAAGHFFATHLDSVAGRGLHPLVHSLVQVPSTGGVENLRCAAGSAGLARHCSVCQAIRGDSCLMQRGPLRTTRPCGSSALLTTTCKGDRATRQRRVAAALPHPLLHQFTITCGTKREVSRVIGPSSSRMPSPAGRSATTQLPTSACRPSNTGNG